MIERILRPEILALLIPVIAVAGTFTFLIMKTRSAHRERMAMIEQGMHPDRPELEAGDRDESERDLIER